MGIGHASRDLLRRLINPPYEPGREFHFRILRLWTIFLKRSDPGAWKSFAHAAAIVLKEPEERVVEWILAREAAQALRGNKSSIEVSYRRR